MTRVWISAGVMVAAAMSAAGASGQPADPALIPHSGPIPYSQLVHPSRPVAKPRPRPPVRRPAAKPAPHPTAPHPASAPAHVARPGVAAALEAPPAPRPGARLTPSQAIPPDQLESFVDGVVRQAMTADHVVGVTVSVVQDGRIVLERGWGLARPNPARPVDPRATLFRLGSVSKVFTWIALLREVERGRMGLDRPVNDYLPSELQLPPEGWDRPVLLRHLPTHTAGFEDRSLGRLFKVDPADLRGPDAALKHGAPRRVRPPGELASYSNYGAALAGAAVAQVERSPYADLVEATLTGPLGMAHTSFREPYPARDGLPRPLAPALAEAVTSGSVWSARSGWRALPFEYGTDFAPAVAASSTADDMARLMGAMLGGGALGGVRIYGPATARALRTPLQRVAAGLNGWPGGLMAVRLPGGFVGYGHEGGTLGSRAALTTVPDLRLGVFVAANTDTAGPLTGGLAARVVERFYASPNATPVAVAVDPAPSRGAFDGDYLSSMRAYHGLEGFVDRLSRLARVRTGEDGRLAVSFAGRGRVFAPMSTAGRFRAADGEELLVFDRADRRADAFTAASNRATYERVGFLHRPSVLLGAALIAAAAALLTLTGVLLRVGREGRRTFGQTIGSLLQSATAAVWLGALVAFAVWRSGGRDAADLMVHWPGAWLPVAGWSALAAALLTLACVAQLPGVWRGERRIAGWSLSRKLRHTLTAVVFLAFAALLVSWGALEPWST